MGIKYKSPTPSATMVVPSDDISTSTPALSPIPADRAQEAVKPRKARQSVRETMAVCAGACIEERERP